LNHDTLPFVRRAIGIFAAGIGLGLVIGFAFTRTSQKDSSAVETKPTVASNEARVTQSAAPRSNAEADKIVLGNIATVPFQELYGVLSARSAEELAQLARQLNDLPPGRDTRTKINTFFTAWAHLDAKAALTAAISLKSADARGLAIGSVIRGADAATGQSLTNTLSQLPADALPAPQKTRSLNTALSKWSEVDPVAAAKFLDEYPGRERGFFGARVSIAQNWAATDPTAAMAWAQAMSNPQEARVALSGVISGWWENDPRAAEAYVTAHLDTVGTDAVMRITNQLLQQDPQRARDWASRLSTPEARRSADSFIAMQMAETDPKAASEWAATLPADVRSGVLSGTISRWARNDPQAVAQWINSLNGAGRDEAVSAYSSTVAGKDPVAALNWAVTVSDPKLRTSAVDRIVTGWLRRSPGEAQAWIQNSTLAESEKTRLLSLSPRNNSRPND
jgi:hypothetical protein